MTAIDWTAEARAIDAEVNAGLVRLYRTLLRDRRDTYPLCGDTVTTSRDLTRTCTHPAGHIGLHRDAAGWSWGDTDA